MDEAVSQDVGVAMLKKQIDMTEQVNAQLYAGILESITYSSTGQFGTSSNVGGQVNFKA
jgi:hypothetical protein